MDRRTDIPATANTGLSAASALSFCRNLVYVFDSNTALANMAVLKKNLIYRSSADISCGRPLGAAQPVSQLALALIFDLLN